MIATQSSPGEDEHTPLLAEIPAQPPVRVVQKGLKSAHNVEPGGDGSANSESSPAEHSIQEIEYPSTAVVVRLISILLIGVFISNMDASILLATHSIIASEFNALSGSSWLLTSFALAMASTQSLYGKLSDIFGRKPTLLVAYAAFGIGCLGCGIGRTMGEVIAGRVISGIGGAGMTSLVSIIITDIVPLREVASWRSYINIAATVGRSLGGPIGGYLADTVGWRYSFVGQVPLMGITMLLCWAYLLPHNPSITLIENDDREGAREKLAKVDFLGAILMSATILSFLFPIELGGKTLAWTDFRIISLFVSSGVLALLFSVAETYMTTNPIFPLKLFGIKDVVLSYLVMLLHTAAQLSLMFTVPLYFQITAKASFTEAGAHLFPAVAGNTIGSLLSGYIIHRTGRYKPLIVFGSFASALSYLTLILRWNGKTGFFESLYIFPSGFGMGITQSALFISLTAAIQPSQTAIAASGMYMYSTIGTAVGLAVTSALEQEVLRKALESRLLRLDLGVEERIKIIERAISDISYVGQLKGKLAHAVVSSYIVALDAAHALSLGCSILCIVGGLLITARRL